MSNDHTASHLSESDVILFCDNAFSQEDMLKAQDHLEGCEACKKLIDNENNRNKIISTVLKEDVISENNCLSDMDISAYLDHTVSTEERMRIEKHLSECNLCLSNLVDTRTCLAEGAKEEISYPIERISSHIIHNLREKRAASLNDKLAFLIKDSSYQVQSILEGIKDNIGLMIQNTFAYPSPRFAPVFGEHKIHILSPFGKVRYPIIFEWNQYKSADNYIITIDEIGWSFKTAETKLILGPDNINLDHGKEYMWELKIMSGGKELDAIIGFFTIASENELRDLSEIEGRVMSIKPELDGLILWGSILEEKEFYLEAIEQYKKAYDVQVIDGIAYRIANCYDKLELEELRDMWNKKISGIGGV